MKDNKLMEMMEIKAYIENKYGIYYLKAMAKLNEHLLVETRFDKRGLLKHEFALTDNEREAILYAFPELEEMIYGKGKVEIRSKR